MRRVSLAREASAEVAEAAAWYEEQPRDPELEYPRCVAGRRACPPEDCGGSWGYQELLVVLADPTHPEHAERRDWVGERFSPDDFNAGEVVFADPAERLRFRMEHGL